MAANVNVTHKMLGARSIVATAVGSRPKLNTVSTSAVNTTAEISAVRVRNSSRRSLRATVQACARTSRIGTAATHGPPVRLGDLVCAAVAPRRVGHEPTPPLKGDVGGELDALVHVVRGQDHHAAGAAQLTQQGAKLAGGGEVESRERLIEQQDLRIVHQ